MNACILGVNVVKCEQPEDWRLQAALTTSNSARSSNVAEVNSSSQVEYRLVPEFPGYRVGSDGTIWSRFGLSGHRAGFAWRKLLGGKDKDGYRKVILCRSGVRRHARVAALVLELFVGARPCGSVVCHCDGSRDNDAVANLRWDSQRANIADKRRHGTWQEGERNGNAKVTECIVREIRRRRCNGERVVELSAEFGVSKSVVSSICKRRTWKCVA